MVCVAVCPSRYILGDCKCLSGICTLPTWWRKALHGGTLNDLNHYWEFGDSILAAGTSGRKFNFVAFATLAASTIVVDGPLLQKASSIVSKELAQMVNDTAPIAKELPYDFTEYRTIFFPSQAIVINQTFAQVVNNYNTRTPIVSGFTGCVGAYSNTIKATRLAINCSQEEGPWDNNDTSTVFQSQVFSSNFTWFAANLFPGAELRDNTTGSSDWNDYPFIHFNLVYVNGRAAAAATIGGVLDNPVGEPGFFGNCNGTLVTKRCSMRSATLEYPILMVNNTISLPRNSSSFAVDSIQAVGEPSDFFDYHDQIPNSFRTLGGIAKAAQNMFSSSAIQQTPVIKIDGSLASQYIDYGSGNTSFFVNEDACATNWRDPTSDIVDALNEIMFWTSLVASDVSKFSIINSRITDRWTSYYEMYPVNYTNVKDGIPTPQTIAMQQTSTITVFQSHYPFLAGALAVMVLGVLVVIPLFHSFWEFGRDVSLNPLEIAKAFNAEMMKEQGSNSSLKHLTKNFGEKEVRYGEILDDDQGTEAEEVGQNTKRLELADPSLVINPRFQSVYM
jgi:hypothetical protein